MYGNLFCRVYNEFGWNEYPRVFGEQLLGWLEQKGMKVRSARGTREILWEAGGTTPQA